MLKSIGVLLFIIGISLSLVGSAFAACPEGDLDNNCKVDFSDVMFLAERWLDGAGSQADIIGSDGVNFGDYAIVAGHWLEQGQTTGSVRVTISPPDVIVDGAQWTVDGGERHNSGETVGGLSVGPHTISFIDVPGWATPSDQVVEISAGQTESVSVTYLREYGSLMVDIIPDGAVAAGAQWRVDEGAWRNSGQTASSVYVGGHIVEFKDIDGWVSATDRSVIVSEGQLTAISAEYSQPLVISEFLTLNHSPNPPDPAKGELVDEEGDSSDWIEIYNPTDISIDLSGWYLTDNDSNLVKWQFPAGVELDGGEFLIVFASKKNRRDPAGPYLHTNFKLSSSPSYLALVAADGITIVHEYSSYPTQLSDVSYGLAQSATDIVGEGGMVSYHVPSAGDVGKDWTAIEFEDSSWDTARTPLRFATEAVETGRDIGRPGASGSHSSNNGVYTVKGDGDDIWNYSDNFYYLYAPMSGDGELTARVTSIEYTHDWAKAGVMIRETLDGGSKHAMMIVTPTNLRSFQWRASTGGASSESSSDVGQVSLPYWVKMVRSGSTLTGYYASDSGGVPGTWAVQNSTSISMGTDVYIGLCVTSHSNGVLCTAVFDNVGGSTQAANDLMDAMLGVNASLWVRAEFNLEAGQAETFDTFNLRMRHEDGFVAYLNGQLVAMDNNPTALTWNSTAPTDRPIEASQTFTSTNLMPYLDDLVVGKNVLAIQALNDNKNNEEFLISAELVSTSEAGWHQYFQLPTPGAYNVSGDMGAVGEVWFSHERGFYTTGFYLALSTETSGTEIRYTTDGSTPTDSHGTVYVAGSPIYINKTTPLRVMAWKPGYLASEVMTHTYFFVADVITQSGIPGPGWPASGAVNGQAMDYGMDPDILNDSRYKNLIDDALLAIPSISLATDLENLFDPAIGIYVNPYGEGRNWERPSSAELINPDGSDGFHINAGLRIRGGYSRGTWNPKHAFRLFFRSEYGEANLEFPLFEDEGVGQFDKVDLRTSQNYSWSHGGSSQNTMVRDVFSRDIQGATDQPYTRSRYYHLYINGVYWGLFQTQERAESVHAASYMGGDRDDYDIVKTPGMYASDGTRESLDRLYDETMLGLDSLERYYRVQGMNMDGTRNPAYERLLDVDNVIDFMIIEYYTGDRDGPASRYTGVPNNTYGAYNRVNPDGWKWYHHDNEHTLGAGSAELNMVEPFTTAGAAKSAFNPHWLHQELANINVDYRMRFADYVYKRFYNDGLLTAENARAAIQRRADQIDMAIIGESARWGDASHHPAFTKQDWQNEISWLLYNTSDKRVISDRVPTVIGQFKAVGWYPTLEPPTLSNPGGEVPAGQSLTMTAAATIYYTTDGSDPRLSSAVSTSGSTVTLVAENAAKRVYIPTGPVTSTTGSILYEYYNGISGSSVSDLIAHPGYPDSPSGSSDLTLFEAPTDWADYYGARISGYVHPPTTGNYRFWISSDDNSQLWLSSDETPANLSLIAYEDSWTTPRAWENGNERSAQIYLVAGRKYYIEVLMAEAQGGDNLAVTWDGAGGYPNPIPATYLSPPALPDTWTKLNYNHSSWPSYASGKRGVGYERNPGDPVNYTDLIDINVESAMYGINGTCYIRIPFTVNVLDLNMLKLKIRYDDGFVAYINGGIVATRNFTGTPAWNSAADNGSRDDALARQFEEIDITAHIGKLQAGSNVLAIHGLNGGTSSSDFLISAELVASQAGQGDPSPSAMTYSGAITLDKSMVIKARTFNGAWSPLREARYAVGPVVESLRITEIMYHPQYTGDPDDPNEEYIELQNIGPEPINLNQVRFTNGIDFTFGDIDLAPGQYVVVAAKQSAFDAKYPTFPGVFGGEYAGRLDNGGEQIELVDAIGRTIHDFSYSDGWRSITDGEGFSLTIIDTSEAPPAASEAGLVAHWKLDESSGTTAADSAGTNNGTLYGNPTWVAGRVDGALNLDGAGDYVLVSSTGPLAGSSVTVSAWVKVTGLTAFWNPVLTQHNVSNDGYYFYIYEDQPAFSVSMGGGGAAATSPDTIGWNEWHHLGGTNDGSTIRLYVDGSAKASASSTGLTGVNYALYIGCDYASDAYFSGYIDDVRIYDRALSDYEFGVSSDLQDRWGEKDSWRASVYVDGSPGWDDSGILPNPGEIVINEVLAHSHGVAADWIELYNTTDSQVDIGGWYLSDGADDLKKYMIAAGTKINGHGYRVFYENTNFGVSSSDPGRITPFALSEDGEQVYLSSGKGGAITGYRATEDFGASLTGVSFGRYFKTSTGNYNFVSMAHITPGEDNAYPKVGPIVITEIMYNPQSGDQKQEFIEIHNFGSMAVTLYDSNESLPWKFTDGIDYTFPDYPGLTISAGGYVVLAKDLTAYIDEYGMPPFGVVLLGPYGGWLSNSGEDVGLSRPGDLDEFGVRHYIRVERIGYSDGLHPGGEPGDVDLWPTQPDGGGASLHRISDGLYGNDPNNWTAANPPTPGG